MRNIIVAFAVALAVAPAAASEKTDVIALLHKFVEALNEGDTKAALATCANPASIVDEFPPHAWQGATACADWASDFETYNQKAGISNTVVTLGEPTHVDITGDRAYVVVPANYSYAQSGKQVKESGSIFTVALRKLTDGWRMTGWAWAKH